MLGFFGILGGLAMIGLGAGLEKHDIRKAENNHMFDDAIGDTCPTLEQFDRMSPEMQQQIKDRIADKMSKRILPTGREYAIWNLR